MTKKNETKHQAFLRLMQRRLGRALEELRLVSQLSSENYENTPAEAKEVVEHLDKAVRSIAQVFDVNYTSTVGKPIATGSSRNAPLDAVEIAKTLEHLRASGLDAVEQILIQGLNR